MSFWFGIGVMRLIPKQYDEFYPDEILSQLTKKLELELSDDAELREVLTEPGVDLYTMENSTDRPTVIGAGIGWSGVLPDEIAQPIFTAFKHVEKIDFAPYRYCFNMPDPIADILVPGFGEPIQPSEASWHLLRSRVKLDDFCVTPLQKFWVGGLEQHLTAFTKWRDDICDQRDFVVHEVSREEILDFYDRMLLPMLRFCNDHRLIFVFGF
jgi:hypothetical protein